MIQITVTKRMLVVALAFVLLLIPAAAYAGSVFGDVADGSTHAEAIKYMRDTGITLGCGDGSNYCPDDPVTRAQMATFLYRMSGNAYNPPNVNAESLNYAPPEFYMTPAAATPVTASMTIAHDTDEALMTLSITAPMDGWFMVVGEATYEDAENARVLQWLQVDNEACSNVPAQTESIDFSYAATSSTILDGSATTSGLVSVPAGPHTITLCAREFGSATTTLVRAPSVTAMFTAVGTKS